MVNSRHRQKRHLLYISLGVYTLIIGLLLARGYDNFVGGASKQPSFTDPIVVETPPPPPKTETKTSVLPDQALIDVPFTVQAPLGNWDALHEETCEEASLLMVKHFLAKTTFGSNEQAEAEFQDFVSWQSAHGYAVDLTVQELARASAEKYGLTGSRVIANPSVTALKTELAAGRPVIVPAAGRVLPNPYFTPPGPVYHMLVIKGYDKDGFITNDPGTRRGNSFRYSYDGLMNAIHNWDAANILNGPAVVMVYE